MNPVGLYLALATEEAEEVRRAAYRLLKMRFRYLAKERMLRYNPTKAGCIINVCFVLHNICIRTNIPMDLQPQHDPELPAEEIDLLPSRELKRIKNALNSSSSGGSSDSEEDRSRETTLSGIETAEPVQLVHEVHSVSAVPEDDPHNANDLSQQNNLDFLGARPKLVNTADQPLHEELLVRWSSYLQTGLEKEDRERIIEKYPLLENCPLVKTPLLVPEVASCLDEKTLRHDKFVCKLQYQMGHALVALGVQMNKHLLENKIDTKVLTTLADVSQLICNLHHAMSTHRKYNIMPSLKYSARKAVERSKTDEFLLGKDFVSELKAIEAAKKSRLELKTNKTYTKPTVATVYEIHYPINNSSKHFRIQTGSFFKLEASSTKLQEERINTDVEGQQETISKTLLDNQNPTPVVQDSYIGVRNIIRQSMTERGVPENAIDIMIPSVSEEGIEVRITEKIKTSGKNVLQPVLNFPVFKDCPELCVASVITHYMKITQPFRGSNPYLILTHKKPYDQASPRTDG
ncbi:unnamed protein product [Callosobruchus maculatus]|uniref:DDE Tnp4 domain-containing protein n=1 Tax=Callosobruchus maculatus TaxID=64391 RepID=A0A653DE14_CALMS|nr:unnamed protein product [Callosobruchus maculatus]